MFNFKKWYIAMFGNVITLIKSPLVQKETNHFKKKKKKKKLLQEKGESEAIDTVIEIERR